MNILSRYILSEIARPFAFFVFIFTGVIWLTQSLRVVDTVVKSGQGAGIFLEFGALLLPFVLTIVLPIAAFGATLYAINKLLSESELVAAQASGASAMRLARPVALFGALVTVALYGLTLYLTPTAAATMRDRIDELQADIANALVFDGEFLHPMRGLTIYVRETLSEGEMRGVFVHDRRDDEAEVTYTAREALLTRADDGPRLVMFAGAAQRIEPDTGALSLLRFDSLVFDLTQFTGGGRDRAPKPAERFFTELVAPTAEQLGTYALGRFYAEGHEQLSGPLYALALPLVALATILAAGYSRQGYANRVSLAIICGLGLRVLGLAMRSATASEPSFWPLMYAPPLFGALAALWLLAHDGRLTRAGTGPAGTGRAA